MKIRKRKPDAQYDRGDKNSPTIIESSADSVERADMYKYDEKELGE